MPRSVRRALALASSVPLLAGALVAAAPAAHASHVAMPACGAGSTVLADFEVLGDFRTRVATYDAAPDRKHLCLQLLYWDQFTVVLDTEVGVTPPTVTQTAGTGSCAQRVLDVYQPVQLSVSVGVNTSGTPSLCLGKDGVTTTISVTGPSVQSLPDVEVWSAGDSYFQWYVWCMPRFVEGAVSGSQAGYVQCRTEDQQIV